MATLTFGQTQETVVSKQEVSVAQARETLKNETIAVLGYGVQGPGQSLNLRDNGFNVIVGQRQGSASWDKAVADGWVPGETLFPLEEAAERGTFLCYLLSDAGQMHFWPTLQPYLNPGKTLCFSHGFAVTYDDQTKVTPPEGVDVVLVAPKGSGTSVRRLFKEGRGINASYAVYQDATGQAEDKVVAFGIGVGSGYLFKTPKPQNPKTPKPQFCSQILKQISSTMNQISFSSRDWQRMALCLQMVELLQK